MEELTDHGFLVRYGGNGNKNWLIDWGGKKKKTWSNDTYFHTIQEKL